MEKKMLKALIIGDKNSGKTTLINRLISLTGGNKNDDEIKKVFNFDDYPPQNFKKMLNFPTPKKIVTIIGTLRNQKLICPFPSTHADFALTVIDATPPGIAEFTSNESIAKNDINISNIIGITKFIVVVNKMDEIGYSEEKFKDVSMEVAKYMLSVGVNLKNVIFVPVSSLTGENLITRSSSLPWWDKKSLIDVINDVYVPDPIDLPLRILVTDYVPTHNAFIGDVVAGSIKEGMKVLVAPAGVAAEVSTIIRNRVRVTEAFPGQVIAFSLSGNEVTNKNVKRGCVICNAFDHPIRTCKAITAVLHVHDRSTEPMVPGFEANFAFGRYIGKWKLAEILKKIVPSQGNRVEDNPECVLVGDIAVVRLTSEVPCAAEPFDAFGSELGTIWAYDIPSKRGLVNGLILSVEY